MHRLAQKGVVRAAEHDPVGSGLDHRRKQTLHPTIGLLGPFAVLLDQFDETLADSGDDPHPVLVATRRLAKQLAAQRRRRRQNPDHAAT